MALKLVWNRDWQDHVYNAVELVSDNELERRYKEWRGFVKPASKDKGISVVDLKSLNRWFDTLEEFRNV